MKIATVFAAAATVVSFAAPAAFAADMPSGWYAPAPVEAVVVPDYDGRCSKLGGRQVDNVYQPPQNAYILAARCPGHHDRLLVYYNGGSRWRTDIRILNR